MKRSKNMTWALAAFLGVALEGVFGGSLLFLVILHSNLPNTTINLLLNLINRGHAIQQISNVQSNSPREMRMILKRNPCLLVQELIFPPLKPQLSSNVLLQ